jgi:hypothetical protein
VFEDVVSEEGSGEATEDDERLWGEGTQGAGEVENGSDLRVPVKGEEQEARGRGGEEIAKGEGGVDLALDAEVSDRSRGAGAIGDEVGEGGQAERHDHDLASVLVPSRGMEEEGQGRGHGGASLGTGAS